MQGRLTRASKIAAAAAVAGSAVMVAGAFDATAAFAATPTVTTLTFTATGGSLYYPEGITTNNNGTVYVSNTNDNVVASITGATFATDTTVAGSYEGSGESGDNGPAINATLTNPGGLATDGNGDLFIADTEDNVVREITPDGTIHLIAGTGEEGDTGDGGPATAATLDNPQGVAVDSKGDVFIADTYNNVIREVTPDGTITTVAGNGNGAYSGDGGAATAAELNMPSDVAVDSLGNLYIADSANNLIRRVSENAPDAGTITTVAGNYALDQANGGSGADSGDGGPATQAQLFSPQGIALDRAGDLFIADTYNNAIREVTPSGTISSVVSTGLSGPYDVAVDNSSGNLFIADTHNNKVKEVTGLGVPGPAAGGPVNSGPGTQLPEAPLVVGFPLAAIGIAYAFILRRRRKGASALLTAGQPA